MSIGEGSEELVDSMDSVLENLHVKSHQYLSA